MFLAELQVLKLAPQHEPFTELYFQDYRSVPKVVSSGQPYSFSFVIHNMEGKGMVYPYAAYVQDPLGSKIQLSAGSVTVQDGGYAIVPVSFMLTTVPPKAEVFVDLSEMHQDLHFTIVGAQ